MCSRTGSLALFMMILAMTFGGCSSPGELIMRKEPPAHPQVGTVPMDGIYGIFVAGEDRPVLTFSMKKDDPIGFESDTVGREHEIQIQWLIAIAGKVRQKLDPTLTYEWRRLPSGN